jgi:hypothetical protein
MVIMLREKKINEKCHEIIRRAFAFPVGGQSGIARAVLGLLAVRIQNKCGSA